MKTEIRITFDEDTRVNIKKDSIEIQSKNVSSTSMYPRQLKFINTIASMLIEFDRSNETKSGV